MAPQNFRSFRRNVNNQIPNQSFGPPEGNTAPQEFYLETSSGAVVIEGATVINDVLTVEAQSLVRGGFDFGTF